MARLWGRPMAWGSVPTPMAAVLWIKAKNVRSSFTAHPSSPG